MNPCSQHECDKPGAFRYTWPGKDEQAACEEHAPKLRAVADALGMYLQLIPLRGQEEESK